MAEFTNKVLKVIQHDKLRVDQNQVRSQLDRMPNQKFESMSEGAQNVLVFELKGELERALERRRTRPKVVDGGDVRKAAKRIGLRIRSGRGEFSSLSEADRNLMIEGCPYC